MGTGGEVANALVCKTSIHGFNSHPVLQRINKLRKSIDAKNRVWGKLWGHFFSDKEGALREARCWPGRVWGNAAASFTASCDVCEIRCFQFVLVHEKDPSRARDYEALSAIRARLWGGQKRWKEGQSAHRLNGCIVQCYRVLKRVMSATRITMPKPKHHDHKRDHERDSERADPRGRDFPV